MNDALIPPTGVDYEGLRTLQEYCHQQSRSRGFYDEPDRMMDVVSSLRETDPKLANYIYSMYLGNRLLLIIGEASEAHEEERAGRAPTETYYSYPPVPPSLAVEFASGADAREHWESTQTAKPEGVPSELADILIRVMDHASELKIDLAEIVKEKLEYNATRSYLHGKKF